MEKGGNTCFSEQNVFPSTSVNHEDIGLNEKEPPQTSQAFLNSLPDAHLPTTRKGLACDRQTATVTPAKTKKLEILYNIRTSAFQHIYLRKSHSLQCDVVRFRFGHRRYQLSTKHPKKIIGKRNPSLESSESPAGVTAGKTLPETDKHLQERNRQKSAATTQRNTHCDTARREKSDTMQRVLSTVPFRSSWLNPAVEAGQQNNYIQAMSMKLMVAKYLLLSNAIVEECFFSFLGRKFQESMVFSSNNLN